MSFWALVGVTISDLECFKQSCKKHGITYQENSDTKFQMQGKPVHAVLTDPKGSQYRNQAYLVREGGAYQLVIDNDANYCSITKRLGQNGGKLTRDYTHETLVKSVKRMGALVNSTKELPDGSVILKVSAMR